MVDRDVTFAEFRLDIANQCVWRGAEMIALTPKCYAVLCCLITRAGQLVSKAELLDTVWPDTSVTDASLKVCVRDIRRALNDPAAAPRLIATVHRRGYRFIGAVASLGPPTAPSLVDSRWAPTGPGLVGRTLLLAALDRIFARAQSGARQIVFLTGESGIGKTAIAEAFIAATAAPAGAVVARGRCLEHYGAVEAYLPLLDALAQLCRTGGPALRDVIRRRAPTWLAQMPWLVAEGEREALHGEIFGGTRERMLREATELIETLAGRTPLVLLLEDLHWSDPSTLDLLAAIGQRPDPARLLVLATYRPVEAIGSEHPITALKGRLIVQRQATEVALEPLSRDAVRQYLEGRLGGPPPRGLATLVFDRTDGNPLFMRMLVDMLLANGSLVRANDRWQLADRLAVAHAIPDGLRHMIEHHADRSAQAELAVLETAALLGDEFSAAAVAAVLDAPLLEIESRCEALAHRRHWIGAQGVTELEGGEVSGRYRFVHGLYRTVLAERMPAARRVRLHQRIAAWVEQTAGERMAPALAQHFEHGRNYARAIDYLRVAARTAMERHANREAADELTRALALSVHLPEAQRGALRRALLERRAVAYRAMGDLPAALADLEGWAASARADADGRAETRALLAASATWSLRDRARCLSLAEQAVARSAQVDDVDLQRHAAGYAAYCFVRIRGWDPSHAVASERALAAARRRAGPGVLAAHLGMRAYFDNVQSNYAGAAATALEGATIARRSGDGFTHALCQFQQSWALLHAGRWGSLLGVLDDALRIAERNEQRAWSLAFTLLLAWWATQAGDPAMAAAPARAAVTAAHTAGHEYGAMLAGIVAGWSALGCGDRDAAGKAFALVQGEGERNAAAVEWVLRLPLQLGLSACAFAGGDLAGAGAAAERARALAAGPHERTYLALAHRAAAAVAIAQRRWTEAERKLHAAQSAIASGDAPLAEWRVWSTAAALAAARRQPGDAAAHRRRSRVVLERLRASLDRVPAATADALGIAIPRIQDAIRSQARDGDAAGSADP